MGKKIHTGHPGKNAHDKSPSWKAKTLTRSGAIKDLLSKDHDHQGMGKKIHTGHPGKNAHDKSPWKVKTLIHSGVNEDSSPKDHNPFQPGKSTHESFSKLKF